MQSGGCVATFDVPSPAPRCNFYSVRHDSINEERLGCAMNLKYIINGMFRGGKIQIGVTVALKRQSLSHLSFNRYDKGSEGYVVKIDGGAYVDVKMKNSGKVEIFNRAELEIKPSVRAFCPFCNLHTERKTDGGCATCSANKEQIQAKL